MKELICIVCPKGCHLKVDEENGYSVTGNACPRGAEYGKKELTAPTRVITSIPKGLIFAAMELLNDVELQAPVRVGDIVIEDICGTGIPFVAARDL